MTASDLQAIGAQSAADTARYVAARDRHTHTGQVFNHNQPLPPLRDHRTHRHPPRMGNQQGDNMSEQLDAIRQRIAKATPGPWDFNGTEIDNVPDSDGDTPWKSIMECRVDCGSYCYGGSVAMGIGADDRELIAHAPTDITHLLATIDRVEALAAAWEARGEHDMAYSKTIPDEDIAMALLTEGASMVENARHIRNAIAGAS